MNVYLRHFSALKYCHKGARAFFVRHGLMDWSEFLANGIPAEDLANTGDAMALDAVAYAQQEAAASESGNISSN